MRVMTHLATVRRATPVVLVLALLVAVLAALGATYVSHASSPYDTCMAPNGRYVSCAFLRTALRR